MSNGYNVKDYGAKGDRTTDDTAAFINAIKFANDAGSGNTVIVPGNYGENYVISDVINLNSKSDGTFAYCCKLLGLGTPLITVTPSTDMETYAAFVFWEGQNDYGNPLPTFDNLKILFTSSTPTANGILCTGGNRPRVSRIVIGESAGSEPGGDGIVMATTFNNGWIEGGWLEHCQVSHCGGYSYKWVNGNYTSVFITESGMMNCSSRFPGIAALGLIQNNTSGGNYKIGDFKAYSCEFSCSGGSSPNGIDLVQNSSTSGNIIEAIHFADCTIEDDAYASHTGYAIGKVGSGTANIGPLRLTNITYYGFAGGRDQSLDYHPRRIRY